MIVLGDMRDLYHHGCNAVMAALQTGLTVAGLPPARILPGLTWRAAAAECCAAPLVVINGEGALHDSRPCVAEILELAERRRAAGRPTALINSSWWNNNAALTRRLLAFDLVAIREPASAAVLQAAGIPYRLVPDLAIEYARQWRELPHRPEPTGLVVSDSTRPEVTRALAQLAAMRGWRYVPVLARPDGSRSGPKARKLDRRCRWLGWLRPLLSPRYQAHLVGMTRLEDYCAAISSARGVVTGRFHTACMALALEVPCVAVASNTPKIESLLTAAGLNMTCRMATLTALDQVTDVPPFDVTELTGLRQFLATAALAHRELFVALRNFHP